MNGVKNGIITKGFSYEIDEIFLLQRDTESIANHIAPVPAKYLFRPVWSGSGARNRAAVVEN